MLAYIENKHNPFEIWQLLFPGKCLLHLAQAPIGVEIRWVLTTLVLATAWR